MTEPQPKYILASLVYGTRAEMNNPAHLHAAKLLLRRGTEDGAKLNGMHCYHVMHELKRQEMEIDELKDEIARLQLIEMDHMTVAAIAFNLEEDE